MKCPYCEHGEHTKAGRHKSPRGVFQRYKCGKCYRTFKGEKIAEVGG